MAIIDLNVDYTDVQNEDRYPVVPGGDYDFTVVAAEAAQTAKGRPQIKWQLEVINPDDNKKVKIRYNTVLPWMTPNGLDVGGVGLLVALCKAVGKPWSGTTIDPDDYIGRSGRATVIQKPGRMQNDDGEWIADPDPANKQNDVKKFLYEDTTA